MNATHAAPAAPSRLSPQLPVAAPAAIGELVRSEGRSVHLDEILYAIVVSAIGPDARVAVAREEWARIEAAIRGRAAAVAGEALERLGADLEVALHAGMPDLARRMGDQRQRAELGYD